MAGPPSESELIRDAITGDRAALSQLLLIHYDELLRYVVDRFPPELQSVMVPEDLMQQSFIRVARSIDRFEMKSDGTFIGWLKTIAGNLIKDAHKRWRRERRADGTFFAGPPDPDRSWGLLVDAVVGDSTSPSRMAHRSDSVRRLRAAMASLPSEQREVIQRYYLEDQSLEHIADSMRRSKDAIRGICYRARHRLRELLGHSSWYYSG